MDPLMIMKYLYIQVITLSNKCTIQGEKNSWGRNYCYYQLSVSLIAPIFFQIQTPSLILAPSPSCLPSITTSLFWPFAFSQIFTKYQGTNFQYFFNIVHNVYLVLYVLQPDIFVHQVHTSPEMHKLQ